ncbi:hypothetical protein ACFT08_26955 [Streptomyces rochei]|uniref:hypothetical protein n=1 Tax=Streptomyces rochei TaxID=1928 RepID=UPI003631AA43
MLGHTIDHRLRISLGAPIGQPIKEGVRRAVLDDVGWPSPGVISTVQATGTVLREELDGYEDAAGQLLTPEPAAEDRLIRLCHIASSFEAIFRCVRWARGDSLGLCKSRADLDDLVAAVPDYVVDGARAQMALASSPGPFARLQRLPADQRICGPVFDGSLHVSGADFDFILDGTLIDCKATVRLERLGRAEVYQLAGYLLLDYSNQYAIEKVSLYLSRQGALIDWSVPDFLGLLGVRLDLPTLRAACRHVLTNGTEGEPPPPEDQRRPLPRLRNTPLCRTHVSIRRTRLDTRPGVPGRSPSRQAAGNGPSGAASLRRTAPRAAGPVRCCVRPCGTDAW